jgi:hypothetical protein
MWSGPRNISTAMMRSWGNRSDTFVCDEPLYAYYLTQRDPGHPGADEVLAHHETDWREVVRRLTGPIPGGKPVFYQKQMAHHLLPEIDRGWLADVRNCFLIRDPREMLISLHKRMGLPTLEDTGLPQQVEIFELVRRETDSVPPVVDARDVLTDPAGMLSRLCDATGVPFEDRMLSWPEGRRETDGIWAKHWYAEVERSTGFRPYEPRSEALPDELQELHASCREYYEILHARRLGAGNG